MTTGTIKLRTAIKDGVATVRALIRHPMDVGSLGRKGEPHRDPHYIHTVTCEHNGAAVFTAHWGFGIAKDPYLSFEFGDAKAGDRLSIRWEDNHGESDALEATL